MTRESHCGSWRDGALKHRLHSAGALLPALAIGLGAVGCAQGKPSAERIAGEWLIPKDEIYEGCPEKDCIPPLATPATTTAGEAAGLQPADLVVGLKTGDEVRAYPHRILDWHEIVNDVIGGLPVAVTYCPLTGTAIAIDRQLAGGETTFGVSGLLYNTNLVAYDRQSGSNWSQMMLEAVHGPLRGEQAKLTPLVETTWATWKAMFPQSTVVSDRTGHDRPYGRYPYDDYRTNHGLILYPVANDDGRLRRKQRVHGVIAGGRVRVYPLQSFADGLEVVNDMVGPESIVVVGSRGMNLMTSYARTLPDGSVLTFRAAGGRLPVCMTDGEGNEWTVFGEAVAGPRAGTRLASARGYTGFWFAWAAFFPQVEIWTRPT